MQLAAEPASDASLQQAKRPQGCSWRCLSAQLCPVPKAEQFRSLAKQKLRRPSHLQLRAAAAASVVTAAAASNHVVRSRAAQVWGCAADLQPLFAAVDQRVAANLKRVQAAFK